MLTCVYELCVFTKLIIKSGYLDWMPDEDPNITLHVKITFTNLHNSNRYFLCVYVYL